jgi:prophage regulatory protein
MRHTATTPDSTNDPAVAQSDRIVTWPAVRERVPMDRSTVYRQIRDGRFPAPVDLGLRRLAWRESDINAWIASREAR